MSPGNPEIYGQPAALPKKLLRANTDRADHHLALCTT
jgi:hypothetical protein